MLDREESEILVDKSVKGKLTGQPTMYSFSKNATILVNIYQGLVLKSSMLARKLSRMYTKNVLLIYHDVWKKVSEMSIFHQTFLQ